MTDIKTCHYLSETIAEVTNLKVLELYRDIKLDRSDVFLLDHHMVELVQRIIEAISEVPEPDEYEIWLRERKRSMNNPESSAITPAPIPAPDEVAEARNERGPADDSPGDGDGSDAGCSTDTPRPTTGRVPSPDPQPAADETDPVISGAGSDPVTESNEPLTTDDQPQAEKPQGDAVTGAAVVHAVTSKKERHPIAEQIEAYMAEHDLSLWKAAKHLDCSGQLVANILQKGASPRKKTLKRIKSALNKTKSKKNKAGPVKTAAPLAAPKGPAQFVSMKTLAWMGREHLGVTGAAARLSLSENTVRSIQAGKMPPRFALNQLAKHIPCIKSNLHSLIKASADKVVH